MVIVVGTKPRSSLETFSPHIPLCKEKQGAHAVDGFSKWLQTPFKKKNDKKEEMSNI